MDEPTGLSVACFKDKQTLHELIIHLESTQKILIWVWFCGNQILDSNKALAYDGHRTDMKFNIINSYGLLHMVIDSTKKNLLGLQKLKLQMLQLTIKEEWSVSSYWRCHRCFPLSIGSCQQQLFWLM